MNWFAGCKVAENQLEQYQTLNLFPSAPGVFDDPAMKEKEPFFGGQATGPVFAESAQDVPDAFFGETISIRTQHYHPAAE